MESRYIWDIPPRMKKKNSAIFGQISNKDVFPAAAIIIGAIVLFVIFKNINLILGLGVAVVMIGFAFYMFLSPNQYGETNRILFNRKKSFNKKQKIYYYQRTYNSPIYTKNNL